MPNIKKKPENRLSKQIPVRVTESMLDDLNAMAAATEVSTADRCRRFLESELRKWKASRKL